MSKEIAKAWEATVRKSQAAARKRASTLFSPASIAPAVEEEDGTGEVSHAEKVLPSGDFYTGQCADNLPHGHGKYLWTDGCMYVGEWFRGKTMGNGKFCWPSGATYEGDFKNGYMDGKGTYTGSSGDTYRGSWVMNLKHGYGTKSYANGDYYEGEWRRGMQHGHGRYQWDNGNHYIGHWKNGIINGNGTLIWSNGNRYDGIWEDGSPKGSGTFRWADGSFYVGIWSRDPREQNGTYYPSGSSSVSLDWDPQDVFSVDLSDCLISPCEKVSVFPSQKILNWPGVDGEILQKQTVWLPGKTNDSFSYRVRRRSVDGRISNADKPSTLEGEGDVSVDCAGHHSTAGADLGDDVSSLHPDNFDHGVSYPQYLRIHPVKRQGETISKGHKNYDLMLNLQLGIRHSVARPAPASSLDLRASAFDPKEKVWTKFPPEGSKHTPPHQSCDFRWKDYCPLVFRTLRKLFKVDAADYMLSICGNDALRELSSPGKSGSFFYLTNDDKYMIKTMKKSEVKVLLRMLPAYYNHVRAFENTLVTKFFGLHCVKLTGTAQKKVRFVIMGNLFCSEYAIHRRFDLKGSSHGRTTDKADGELDPTLTLKDLDLNFIFRLPKFWFQEFSRQVDRDCDFLEQEKIMDYSFLVGLHFCETMFVTEIPSVEGHCSGVRTPTANGDMECEIAAPRSSNEDADQPLFDPGRWSSIKLGVNMPAQAEQTVRRVDCEQLVGDPTGELYNVILFFGIIDILQDYDISKKLEHAYKSMQYDPTSISAVDPRQYSKRFRDFIFRVFVEN